MDALQTLVQEKITRSQNWFFARQNPDGHWHAELEGDALLQGELIIILAFLGKEDSPLAKRLAQQLINTQAPDGGWPMFPGGKSTVPNTVKAYFALKLTGHPLSADYMQRARRCILSMGGADKVNSFTRCYLALLGQIPYSICPAVPPEMVMLPRWFPINIYAMSSWTRTIVMPLSIVSALRPVREIPVERGIRELFIEKPENWGPLRAPGKPEHPGFFSWDSFFRVMDRALKFYQNLPWKPTRRAALKRAENWVWDHCQNSDGPGAIQPPIMWGLVAMKALGYDDDHEKTRYFWDQLMNLVIDCPEEGTARCEPCLSPVWDTIITMRAMAAGGVRADSDPRTRKAVDWVLDHQIHAKGDWSLNVKAKPCMWCFEYRNDFYPDCDDTAMAIMALRNMVPERGADPRVDEAIDGALAWLRAMQNSDGGWGAFDRNNNKEFLTQVPFADHNAMTDPSTPDLTARILECFGTLGFNVRQGDRNLDRSIEYIRRNQRADGSWFGRWGANYIYGTGEILAGLAAVGVPKDDEMVRAGINWLLAHQQPCGGWGETLQSYEDVSLRGTGTVTPSQTAWALLGLIGFGMADDPAVRAGIQWLAENQQEDGGWDQTVFTGTGFPAVFYLRYHFYHQYFPLMAISRWLKSVSGTER